MRKYRLSQTALIIAAGSLIPLFVLFKNIFPEITLRLGNLTEFGYGLVERQTVDGSRFLVAAPPYVYPFTKAKVSLELEGKNNHDRTHVTLIKDYIANGYPIGKEISEKPELNRLLYQENPPGIPNGALYTRGDAVFVISRGKYHPIVSPQAFEAMGYQWDNLASIDGEQFARLAEGEKVNQTTPHPDGTVLKTAAGEYFLVWEGVRHPVEYDNLASVWKTAYWVEVKEKEPYTVARCEVAGGKDELVCTYRFEKEALDGPARAFLVTLDPWPAAQVQQGQVKLITSVSLDKGYLRLVLGQIKNNLYTRYAGYFF